MSTLSFALLLVALVCACVVEGTVFHSGTGSTAHGSPAAAGGRGTIKIVDGTRLDQPADDRWGRRHNRPHGRHHDGHHNSHHHHDYSHVYSRDSKKSSQCPPGSVLRVEFATPSNGDGKLYGNVWAGGVQMVREGDAFEYEIMWADEDCNCGTEIEAADWRLRDDGPLDANGYSPHSEHNSNMSTVAYRRWYHRSWSLDAIVGKYMDKYVLSAQLPPDSKRVAYFRYIRVVAEPSNDTADDEPRKVVWRAGMDPPSATAYFPGTITTQCVMPVEISGASTSADARRRGESRGSTDAVTVSLRGMIISRSLSASGGPMASLYSSTCEAYAFPGFFEKLSTVKEKSAAKVAVQRKGEDGDNEGGKTETKKEKDEDENANDVRLGNLIRLRRVAVEVVHRDHPKVTLLQLANHTAASMNKTSLGMPFSFFSSFDFSLDHLLSQLLIDYGLLNVVAFHVACPDSHEQPSCDEMELVELNTTVFSRELKEVVK